MKTRSALASLLLVVAIGGPLEANVEALFSSANHGQPGSTVIADRVIQVMNKAEKSIKIAVAHFNSASITKALIDIHERRNKNASSEDDLSIEVLLDLGEYGDKKSKSKLLEAAGITVRYKMYSVAFFHPQSQLMHHKFMLIDGKELVTGSYNWSDTAELKNYENILHWWGRNTKEIIKDFQGEFAKLWDQRRDRFPSFLASLTAGPGDPRYRRVVPVHFNSDYFRGAMTVTRSELAKVRSAFARMGFYRDRGNSGRRFFDRESGRGGSDLPAGRFMAEDDVTAPPPGAAPSTSSPGVVGELDRRTGGGE